MSTSIFSPSWYRVANLKPRLRSHAKIHRQQFRGQVWFVLQDPASGQFHRFSPSAHLVISLMNGKRTLQEVWDTACDQLDDDILTQDDTIRLVAQLHQSDVLQADLPPDVAEMSERAQKQRRKKFWFGFLNPMAVRIPVLDPERFIRVTFPLIRPLFSWFGLTVLLGVILAGLVQATVHWSELTENIVDRVIAAESLLLLVVTYPIVKALHELGHCYAVKNWGGEVHELGLMFLIFIPVPYVDASASAAFPDKWARALVGAAGILVELLLASIALFVWLNAEPGLVRAFAFNVMLIGGVSTLLFNGNPLLKFDGYYVLADLIEIPNLAQRANRYLGYLVQRYVFGASDAASPVTARGEAAWFVCYAIAAFAYRLVIMVAIILFVATKFFFFGVLLAIWSVVMMYGLPLAKGFWFLFTSPVLHRKRARAITAVCVFCAGLTGAALSIPVPYGTVSEGVIWVPGDSVVHAATEGFVSQVLVEPNSFVEAGAPLIQLEDPLLSARVRVLEAEALELKLRFQAINIIDRAEGAIIQERLKQAIAELQLNQKRFRDLTIYSPMDGQFIVPKAADMPGQYVKKGDTLAYVTDFTKPIAQVIVSRDVIDLVTLRTGAIEVRMEGRVWDVETAEIAFDTPAAKDSLPNPALSTEGGGQIAMDPTRSKNPKTLESHFELQLNLNPTEPVFTIGSRVYVRFDHGNEALVWRAYRNLRQIFLRQFNV